MSKQLGPYEILDVVGAGGMGVVYRARDTRLDRQVAIKVLLPDVASSEDAIARFEREVRAVAAISHPNILAIHDFQRDGGTVYAVMEFLDGRTLRAMVNDSPLSVRKAVHLGVQIAHGLAAAHARNIVHRDLKPENIGLMRSGQVKILDFGLARHVVPQAARADSPTCAQVSTAGMILGTVGYMSPEQVRGHDVDHRSDLFSFGAVFHEMLTGRRAFARATAAETLTAILNDEPSDLADSGAKVPPALDRVIQRCLEKHPEDRFHSARDLAFALENALTANGTAVVPPARRRTGQMWVAAVLVACSLAAGAGISSCLRPVTEQYSVRSLTLSGQDGDPAASPAGDWVAYTSNRDGDAKIWIRGIDTVTQLAIETPISGTEGGHRPRFYPDGKSLLFLLDDGRVEAAFYVNLNEGKPRPLALVDIVDADPSPNDDGEIAWARNSVDAKGRRFAQVGLYNTTTKQERPLFDPLPNVEFANVRWSPNGRQIAAIRRSVVSATSTAVVIIDRAGTAPPRVLDREGEGAYGSLAWMGDSRALVVTQSAAAQVFVPGVLGRILKIDVASNRQQVLLRQPNLFGRSSRANANATIDVMGDGRLVFSSIQIRQTLRECELIDGGGCADNAATGRKGAGTRGNSNDRQPAYSPDGRFIVFSSNRTLQLDLWVQDTQNGGLWQLTDDAALDWDPAFTPDGTHVLWSSDREGDHLEIWMARFDPTPNGRYALTNARRVSKDGKDAQNPTMTKNLKWIVYASRNEAKPGIWKVPAAGGESLPLVGEQFVRLPDVSPGGRYAAYLADDRVGRQNAIRVVDVETGQNTGFEIKVPYRRTESTADVTWGRARWMNNGEWIMFVGQDRETGEAAVYKQQFSPSGADTSATRVPLVHSLPGASTESIAVEPNSRDISVSDGYYSRSLMLAEHVPGVVGRPRRN